MKKGIKTNLRISLRFVLLVMLCYSIRRNSLFYFKNVDIKAK